MPIGLPDSRSKIRECDRLARTLLKKRSSTIFSPPTREALVSDSYQAACALNYRLTDRKISKQAWNLGSKILELDKQQIDERVYESHPELCFLGLSGAVLLSNKKNLEGQSERLEILRRDLPAIEEALGKFHSQVLKKDCAKDDSIDAASLALSCALSGKEPFKLMFLPEDERKDTTGKRKQIAFWNSLSR